jgi:hypothetical protein
MAKRITIDQLAQMVAQGFSELRNDMDRSGAGLRAEMHGGFREIHDQLDEHGLPGSY